MRRRDLLALVGMGVAVRAHAALAQLSRPSRLAFMASSALPPSEFVADPRMRALLDRLTSLGYANEKTVTIDYFLAPSVDDLPVFASRAIAQQPDVILCSTTPAAVAAKSATATIPIVMVGLNDPVAAGLVASLPRPGGNVTGNTQTAPDLAGKQLGLIKELLPNARKVGVLALPADPSHALILAQLRPAAQTLGIEPVIFEFVDAQEFDGQLARVAQAKLPACIALTSQYFTTHGPALVDFQIKTAIVLLSGAAANSVGVVGYGANNNMLWAQAAEYVDAILKGTKPADLPVQQAAVFDLLVNLRTAKAMGLAIPQSILTQATIVVQ